MKVLQGAEQVTEVANEATERQPPDFMPQHACRCSDCCNNIPGQSIGVAKRVNGRTVCTLCVEQFCLNAIKLAWVLKQ